MTLHRNAKLGLAGRLALVQAIEGGMAIPICSSKEELMRTIYANHLGDGLHAGLGRRPC
jgi:hypothetical protein